MVGFDLLNSDGCWNRFQFIETNQTASACVKTGTVATDAALNFSRAAQLQNRERAGVPGAAAALGWW
jgi:hypothetical protein